MNQIAIQVSDETERTISVDWRVDVTAEFRLTLYRSSSLRPAKPSLTWESLGRSRYPQTHRFRDLDPGAEYRIVAESRGDRRELVATTKALQT